MLLNMNNIHIIMDAFSSFATTTHLIKKKKNFRLAGNQNSMLLTATAI
jgi:hypothetical protein